MSVSEANAEFAFRQLCREKGFVPSQEHLAMFLLGFQARTKQEEYGGWPNRETWACHLWLTNDGGLYRQALCFGLVEDLRSWVEGWQDSKVMEEALFWAHRTKERDTEVRTLFTALCDIGSLWRVDWQLVYNALHEEEEEQAGER